MIFSDLIFSLYLFPVKFSKMSLFLGCRNLDDEIWSVNELERRDVILSLDSLLRLNTEIYC